MLSFRNLKADEIQCREKKITPRVIMLLLYKDARCDMNILDETVTPTRWKRQHSRDNHNCTVSIYDEDLKQWIDKEDTGTESNTEKDKGLASDSFKRACVNWGIGRELYTPIKIMITPINGEVKENGKDNYGNTKYKLDYYVEFYVSHIKTIDKVIQELQISDQNNVVRFTYPNKNSEIPKRSVNENDFQRHPAEEHPRQYYLDKLEKGKSKLTEALYKEYVNFAQDVDTKADADMLFEELKERLNEASSG